MEYVRHHMPGKYKNNRSKSACTLNARKRLNNQAVWPVIFDITGPVCARALKTKIPLTLGPRGHHDWPVMLTKRKLKISITRCPATCLSRSWSVSPVQGHISL